MTKWASAAARKLEFSGPLAGQAANGEGPGDRRRKVLAEMTIRDELVDMDHATMALVLVE